MTDGKRSIELDVEVPGTADEVWRAVATGPGISSWYVPHVVEETEGGTAIASFGPEPEMQAAGRVAVWDPPRRVVFDGGEADEGLSFEWLVEPVEGTDDRCRVRLINSGFGAGSEYKDQYDAMTDGWRLFLYNLTLHMEHFKGRSATAVLPMAAWTGAAEDAWVTLAARLGLPAEPEVGSRIEVTADDAPPLAGTVAAINPRYLALLVDDPAPGTGFLAAETGGGDQVQVSVWMYLYGDEGREAAERHESQWRAWLDSAGT